MKRFFGLLFRALILLTVALVCALTAMRFAIHGREVAVPKFIGMMPSEAERLAASNGLTIQIENRFYSADVPAGRILNQVPPPGEKVRRGWQVRVAESMGPQRVAVPNIIGQSERAAEINLVRRGLQVGTVTTAHLPGSVADTVVAQSPGPEAEGVSSPKVNLVVVAADPDAQAIVMPQLVGRSLDDATRVVVGSGLRIGKVTTAATTLPDAPGQQSATGQPSGPPVTGASQSEPGSAPPASSSNTTASQSRLSTLPIVTRQLPIAGQKVLPNTSVNIEVVR